jgi:predicted DCC family thiol-disulfide oxidoreductase YuxK
MTNPAPLRILYNDTCPICAHEIGVYARADGGEGMQFCPLDQHAGFGLDADTAARQLHVMQGGKLLVGVDAFIAIWAALPRWKWLARAASLPIIRPALGLIYTRLAAPLLYKMHLSRQRKAAR